MSTPYTVVSTDQSSAAVGPYVQAVKCNGLVYSSGCMPIDPVSKTVVAGGIQEQTSRVLANMSAVLAASGASPSSVLKTTIFLKSMDDFTPFNTIYGDFFGDTKPARSCVEVARLPKDVLVVIEFIAVDLGKEE